MWPQHNIGGARRPDTPDCNIRGRTSSKSRRPPDWNSRGGTSSRSRRPQHWVNRQQEAASRAGLDDPGRNKQEEPTPPDTINWGQAAA